MTRPNRRRSLSALAIALLVALVASLAATTASSPAATPRVVNGTAVSPATYASRWSAIATLVVRQEADARKGHFCGGTFIAPQLVATAAHCVVDDSKLLVLDDNGRFKRYNNATGANPKRFQVIGGRRVLSIRNGDRIDIANVLVHPRYDGQTNAFDVALLELARAPRAAAGVTPILPVQEGEDAIWGNGAGVAVGANGPWVAGWGFRYLPNSSFLFSGSQHKPILRPTKPRPKPSANKNARTGSRAASRTLANGLVEAALPIQSDEVCDMGGAGAGVGYGRDFDAATMLCAGTLDTHDLNDDNGTTNGVDSCYGDSGGPLMASTGSALRLVGIVSFGTGCATRDTYGVYTRVAAMRTFLASDPRPAVKLVARPTVDGFGDEGELLRCTPGRWSGAGPITYTYRWVRQPIGDSAESLGYFDADEAYERIPGSTGMRAYRLRATDAGTKVSCLVIASNGQTTFAENSSEIRVSGSQPGDEEDSDDEEDDDEEESLL